MASTDIELHAWQRGVVGVEEPIVYRGEVVGTRLKRSDVILRLLLQGAKRKKYGANPGFGRRRLHGLERKRIEREVREEARERERQQAGRREETEAAVQKKLEAMMREPHAERLPDGWTLDGDDWVPLDGAAAGEASAASLPGAEQTPDSV